MLWILNLSTQDLQISSLLCTFICLMISFDIQKFLILMKSSYYFLCCSCFGVKPKNALPNPRTKRFTPIFFSKSCTVLAFILWLLILSWFLYMEWGRNPTLLFPVCTASCCSTICWRDSSFSYWRVSAPLSIGHKCIGLLLDSSIP